MPPPPPWMDTIADQTLINPYCAAFMAGHLLLVVKGSYTLTCIDADGVRHMSMQTSRFSLRCIHSISFLATPTAEQRQCKTSPYSPTEP